jgi:hypothetical protein
MDDEEIAHGHRWTIKNGNPHGRPAPYGGRVQASIPIALPVITASRDVFAVVRPRESPSA